MKWRRVESIIAAGLDIWHHDNAIVVLCLTRCDLIKHDLLGKHSYQTPSTAASLMFTILQHCSIALWNGRLGSMMYEPGGIRERMNR